MKITELIKVFEKLLPIYREAYNNNASFLHLYHKNIAFGLCFASDWVLDINIGIVFRQKDGYYKNFLTVESYCGSGNNLLFHYPKKCKDLKSRIDFMESEIKDLKRLIKKGYTHV